MEGDAAGWTTLNKSGLATGTPCKVWGVLVKPGAATEAAAVYDGLDTTSGRLFHTFYIAANGSQLFAFRKPVLFARGVYVDFVGNIDEVTIMWGPVD